MKYKFLEIIYKTLNYRKIRITLDWGGEPYKLIKVKGWRTALVDSSGGQRSTITFSYWFDIFTDKIIRDHYLTKYKMYKILNYLNKLLTK